MSQNPRESSPRSLSLSCVQCFLARGRRNILQTSSPGPFPDLMLVGLAPSYKEDLSGRPFSGAQGFLASLLSSAGFSWENSAKSYLCKCKSTGEPSSEAIQACLPKLLEDIKRVKPKAILCFGPTVSMVLTGKDRAWVGNIVLDSFGLGVSCLILPEVKALYIQPELFTITSCYIQKLKTSEFLPELVETLETSEGSEDSYLLNPPEEVTKALFSQILENSLPVAVDIETLVDKKNGHTGLNYLKDPIIGIAFCYSKGRALHLGGCTWEAQKHLVAEFLSVCKTAIYANNLFDRSFLMRELSLDLLPPPEDVQTLIHIIHSGMPKKLDFLRGLYTNFPPYKQVYWSGSTEEKTQGLGWYNCRDVDVTLEVWKKQKLSLSKKQKALASQLKLCENIALSMKMKGLYISENLLAKHYAQVLPEIQQIETSFAKNYSGYDIASPKQLSTLFYQVLKFPRPPRATSKTATDEPSVKYLLRKDLASSEKEVLNQIVTYRKLKKISSTYCEGVFRSRDPDSGFVHPDWRSVGPDTGRWACKGVPIQGFPKHMKDCVQAQGGLFLGADYNRVELFVMAILSEDSELLQVLLTSDVHQEALNAIEEEYPLTERVGKIQARLRAKALVFGTPYGRTPKSIAAEFGVSVAIAEKWQNSFYGRFPNLRKFFEEIIPRFWETHGYVETVFGRRKYTRKLPEAKNHMIQSTAADIFQKAGIKLFFEEGFDLRIAVHDQWVAFIPDSQILSEGKDQIQKRFQHSMEAAVPELYSCFPAPATWGKSWIEL